MLWCLQKTTNKDHQPRELLGSEIRQDPAVAHFLQPSVIQITSKNWRQEIDLQNKNRHQRQ